MAWGSEDSGNKTVYGVQGGEEREFQIAGTTPLKDAVTQVSSAMSLGNVMVTADGRTVEPDEGSNPISSFGKIEVLPKQAGAYEEYDIDDEVVDSDESLGNEDKSETDDKKSDED